MLLIVVDQAPFLYCPPTFLKPTSHFTLGAWVNSGASVSAANLQPSSQASSKISLLLGIPPKLVQFTKNAPGHVDHAYHVKRILYLLKVKQMLLESSLSIQDCNFVPLHDDMRRPVLEFTVIVNKRTIRYVVSYPI